MPVTNVHKSYAASSMDWRACRDAIEGEGLIKSRKDQYLPRLDKQSDRSYDAYLKRAAFYNVTGRTVQAVMGAVFRKAPVISPEYPEMESAIRETFREVLSVGRSGLLVDLAPIAGSEPYICEYAAEDIINWRYKKDGDSRILELVVLRECVAEPDPRDKFENLETEQYRVLELIDGIYNQTLWTVAAGGVYEPTITAIPQRLGVSLDFIPFTFVGAIDNYPDVNNPPLIDLVRTNLSHYRTMADLEHGRHFCALPTPWLAGFSTDTEVTLGAETALVSDNANAKVGFLEFTGSGLTTLETAASHKEQMMARLGARLFEPTETSGVIAAETVRLRQSSETATAASIARNVSLAYTQAYNWMLGFKRNADTGAEVTLNTDILDESMKPEDINALVNAWQKGAISMDTMLWNLQQGEVLPPETTLEEEKTLIGEEDAAKMDRLAKYMQSTSPSPTGTPNTGLPNSGSKGSMPK